MDLRDWAGVEDVPPGLSRECWSGSIWVERLDVVLERPVDWGWANTGRVVEIGCGTGKGGQTHSGYWMWDSS